MSRPRCAHSSAIATFFLFDARAWPRPGPPAAVRTRIRCRTSPASGSISPSTGSRTKGSTTSSSAAALGGYAALVLLKSDTWAGWDARGIGLLGVAAPFVLVGAFELARRRDSASVHFTLALTAVGLPQRCSTGRGSCSRSPRSPQVSRDSRSSVAKVGFSSPPTPSPRSRSHTRSCWRPRRPTSSSQLSTRVTARPPRCSPGLRCSPAHSSHEERIATSRRTSARNLLRFATPFRRSARPGCGSRARSVCTRCRSRCCS